MKSSVSKRSIIIAGHKTSVSVEDEFWNSLKEIARERGMTLGALVAAIDANRQRANLSVSYSIFCAWRLSRSASLKRVDAPIFAGQSASTDHRPCGDARMPMANSRMGGGGPNQASAWAVASALTTGSWLRGRECLWLSHRIAHC